MPASRSAASVGPWSPPGRRSSTTAPPTRSLSCSPVPSPTSRPWSTTAMRSASWSASSRYWVVSSTVVPVPTRSPISSQRSRRLAGQAADHLDVLPAGEDLVDGGGLARQADAGAHAIGVGADVDARDAGAAGVGLEQGGEHADEGGLAGAVGAEQAVDAAGRDGEAEAVQRADLAEVLGEPLDLDDRIVHGASSVCILLYI